jgi:hypothetical protein
MKHPFVVSLARNNGETGTSASGLDLGANISVNEVNASGTAHLVLPRLGGKCLYGKRNRRIKHASRYPRRTGKGIEEEEEE